MLPALLHSLTIVGAPRMKFEGRVAGFPLHSGFLGAGFKSHQVLLTQGRIVGHM